MPRKVIIEEKNKLALKIIRKFFVGKYLKIS